MASLDEFFPIFEKSIRPASTNWDLNELEKHIRERDQIEYLANTCVNKPNSERLYLETMPPELLDRLIIKPDEEMEDVLMSNDSELELLPVGPLDFVYGSDSETEEVPVEAPRAKLNISEYRQRRQQLALHNSINPVSDPVVDDIQTVSTPVRFTPSTTSTTATTLFANLYNESLMYTDRLSERTGPKIYAYPKHVIPIFSTPRQQQECDEKFNPEARVHQIAYQEIMETLNLPDGNDIAESGSGLFIKMLLTNLKDSDLTLAFAASNLTEEGLIIEAVNQLGLRNDRFSNIVNDWNCDYGVIVETKLADLSQPTQREYKDVDFIICVGAAIGASTIHKLKSSSETPVGWMIALGSIEEQVFKLNVQQRKPLSQIADLEGFEQLFKIKNNWPQYDQYTYQELTSKIVNHVKGWLNFSAKEYQYRSIEQLPNSTHIATFKVQSDEDIQDMDVSSDAEEDIFPTYEIIKKNLTATAAANVQSVILNEYEQEAQQLKMKFESEFKSLLEKYKARV